MFYQYILWGIGYWLIDMVIYLRYFGPLKSGYYQNVESIQDEFREQHSSTLLWEFIGLVVFYPFGEELIFRGPILLLVQHNQMIWALVATFVGGAIFGIIHKFEDLDPYTNRTKVCYSNMICLSIALSGVGYGLLTIIKVSLWPSIIAHSLWNSNVLLIHYSEKYDNFIVRLSILLQR